MEGVSTYDGSNDDTAAWSPDGKLIVFSSDRDGKRKLYVMNADASNQKELVDMPGYQPLFSSDQSKILFHAEIRGRTSIYTVPADGTGLVNLTTD